MKTLHFIPFLLLVMAVTTACPTIEEPEPEEQAAPDKQILAQYENKIDYTPWPAQTKADAGLTGPGGNFSYWWEHRTEATDAEGLWDMCNLSEQQLATMSTRNLARTVYMYPYGFEFEAVSSNTYVGILVEMGRFNGTRELMSRASGASELLRLYQEVHYPDHAPAGTFTELDYSEYLGENTAYRAMPYLSFMLITAVDYGRFQPEELRTLSQAVSDKIAEIESIAKESPDLYSWNGNIRMPYLLGAFVAWHNDGTLTEEDRSDLRNFIDHPYAPSSLISFARETIPQSLARLH